MSISMGDKIELTALQLVFTLSDTIEEAFERARTEDIDPMEIAQQKTLEVFNSMEIAQQKTLETFNLKKEKE